MRVILNQVSTIFTGATLKEKPEASLCPDSYLMQLGDFSANDGPIFGTMLSYSGLRTYSKFVAKPDDLVFRGRGAGINATVITKTDKPIIVASPLITIRPNLNRVNPEYLQWVLTNKEAHRHYAKHISGSFIMGIGKQDLGTLEIDLPDLSIQVEVGKIKKLQTQETELLTRYKNKQAQLYESIINTLSKEKLA